MELPPPLRHAVDRALEGVPLSELARAAAALSQRYRGEVRDGRLHIADERAALAYLATRLPATYAATCAALDAVATACPGFAPANMLDLGSGPGTALWAASACWPQISDVLLIEASPAIRAWGERFSQSASPVRVEWRAEDIRSDVGNGAPRDLVTLAYVLDELSEAERGTLIGRLWAATSGVLVIVEPGTPAGWRRILAARTQLIAEGAHIAAPCPHAAACPLNAPDWCHFAARVARSRIHRQVKDGDVPWEDEKFIYLAASRLPAATALARIVAPADAGSGRVRLKLCRSDGGVERRLVTRREGPAFKAARRSAWGDAFDF